MEKYIEAVIPRKNSLKDYALCFACCMLPMLVGTYLVILFFSITGGNFSVTGLACVICAVLYYIAYKIFLLFYIDWEYILVGDEIRFSKITNKSKRRDILTVNLSKVEKVARITNTDQLAVLRTGIEKKYSFISQTTDDYYFMIAFDKNGKRICLFFEPDERMCDNFKTTLRGKFFE